MGGVKPKYSIVLPTYNSSKYLKAAIDSVLTNDYEDFEFIVSDNCSNDDTEKIVKTYNDKRLKYIKPQEHLCLSAHWNFALKHATGNWVLAFGTDDALTPFVFKLADKLTAIADKNNINAIKTNRVYYFWEGCEKYYGDTHVAFSASDEVEIKDMAETFKSAFYTKFGYFDVPQMYVSAMFRKEILEKAQKYNANNNIIEPHSIYPYDAYLSCLVACLESKYLYCNVPFAWVGSSLASIGVQEKENCILKKDIDSSYSKLACTEYLVYETLKKFLENYKGPVPNYINFLKTKNTD